MDPTKSRRHAWQGCDEGIHTYTHTHSLIPFLHLPVDTIARPMDADKRRGDGRLIGNDVPSGSLGTATDGVGTGLLSGS
jgi:hypothetical protein